MEAERLQSELESYFCQLHAHPEPALQEYETTAYIRNILSKLTGVEMLDLGLPTGALARVVGRRGGMSVALRADIDALPIQEKTQLPYISRNDGFMHACGHDFHTAALLGAAKLLGRQQDRLPGTVYLLFQPAEEAENGAQRVIGTGLFEWAAIKQIFALHVHSGIPTGTIRIGSGAFSAAVDRFCYKIIGRGGHAGMPQDTCDPIPAAARLIGALQEIVSRTVSPLEAAVVSVTHLTAGTTWNIIPDAAELEGTVRTFDVKVRENIRRRMAALTECVQVEGLQAQFQWIPGCEATDNDAELSKMVREVALKAGFAVEPQEPDMSGEDFACYQKKVPGALFHVGVGEGAPLHNACFAANPRALAPAATLLADIAMCALNGLKQKAHLIR